MIRYKVVKQELYSGYSCYATGDYQLEYKKNTVITAKKGTLGIAVFERRYQAEDFIIKKRFRSDTRIIRVIPIGRGKRYPFVCESQDTFNLDIFYNRYGDTLDILLKCASISAHTMKSPPGTIFYRQVKVLE